MARYVRTAVNVPSLTGVFVEGGAGQGSRSQLTFDYEVPAAFQDALAAGHLVLVPFGNRTVQAVVLQEIDMPAVSETRSILQLVDPQPVLTQAQIALADWLAQRTLASISAVIGLFLPPGLAQRADTLFELRPEAPGSIEAPLEKRIIAALRSRGPLRGRQLDRALPRLDWRRTAKSLERRGILRAISVLPPASVRPKSVRTAELAVSPQAARAVLDDLGTTPTTRARRRKAIEYLSRRPGAVNVSWVYAESGCTLTDLQALAERELVVLREQEVWRDPLGSQSSKPETAEEPAYSPVVLTDQQQEAWQQIEAGRMAAMGGQPAAPLLLQGVTGSGKTELYLRAAMDVVEAGRQVIMLVPEIALTPQTVDRFMLRFPGQVGLMHSKLSDGERYDTWRRARLGAVKVIIGARSAIFSPLPRPGLIVVDECHDSSYRQAEPPFYDAVSAAQAYARLCGGLCIMGSATPTVAQRYAADTGNLQRIPLTRRLASDFGTSASTELDLPPVGIVDLRSELKAGNRGAFSGELRGAIGAVLERGEQAILFLNRRGTATHVFCRDCGHVMRCPRCDTPLTQHIPSGERLLCHRCAYERGMPKNCPECGLHEIRAYGLGTEKVEADLQAAFPKARTLRWDWESTRKKEAHEMILHHFAAGRADILIGTQMLAKGLDLPRVTLVGIVMADVGLFLPDPFAAERVFQLLTQVAGRAGRSTRGGRVVLQTFAPDHYAIQAASRHDVDGFHQLELAQRRRLGFPPYTRLLRLEYRHADPLKAEEQARALGTTLSRRLASRPGPQPPLIGPAPCFFSRLEGRYRWQIVVRGADPGEHLAGLRLEDWRVEMDPASLL
jgi:primosomal protein N' (replication factor Y) (superfamily II helicase)